MGKGQHEAYIQPRSNCRYCGLSYSSGSIKRHETWSCAMRDTKNVENRGAFGSRRRELQGNQTDNMETDAAEASANPRHERRDSGSSSLSPPANAASPDTAAQATVASDDDDDDSEDERQPPPAPNATAVQYFSDDPFTFPDPVNYELGHVEEGMTDEQIRQTCGVAHFPAKDLSELAAGDAPDKDFSNAKPASQVQYATFQNFIEPYFRPMEDADLGWLRERGDRVTPFIIPPRGKKHWREVWAEEDAIAAGGSGSASASKETERVEASEIGTLPPEAAEKDSVEVGPMATRLLQLMRPEYRVAAADLGNDNGTNGDQAMGGMGGDDNDDLNNILDVDNGSNGLGGGVNNSFDDPMSMVSSLPPATQMPGSNTEAYKKNTPVSLTGAQINERIRQQMIYLGFIPADDPKPEYDGHFDDEIAGRLRLLQGQLRERVIINGARKARMLDIAKDYMAKQEFDTVAEDLDNQLNSNFAKRTRTMGKKGKAKRNTATGSTAAPAGQAKAAIGDQTRLLMERRTKWKNTVGNVFEEHEKMPRYDVSLWDDEAMRPYIEAEKERWDQDEAEAANLQDELA